MRRHCLTAFANVLSKTCARDDGGDGGDDGGDGEDSFKVSWNASPSLWKPMPSSKVEVKADFTSVGTDGTCTMSVQLLDSAVRNTCTCTMSVQLLDDVKVDFTSVGTAGACATTPVLEPSDSAMESSDSSIGTTGTCTTSGYASDEERRSFGRTINAKRHGRQYNVAKGRKLEPLPSLKVPIMMPVKRKQSRSRSPPGSTLKYFRQLNPPEYEYAQKMLVDLKHVQASDT
jgi:hypothetical protein